MVAVQFLAVEDKVGRVVARYRAVARAADNYRDDVALPVDRAPALGVGHLRKRPRVRVQVNGYAAAEVITVGEADEVPWRGVAYRVLPPVGALEVVDVEGAAAAKPVVAHAADHQVLPHLAQELVLPLVAEQRVPLRGPSKCRPRRGRR
jgi:hypothetical protein